MNILIAGGSGFIGHALVKHRLAQHDTITVLGRDESKIRKVYADQVLALTWEDLQPQHIEKQDIIINLCGVELAKSRWTRRFKQHLLDSRIRPTERLAKLVAESVRKPALLNASGVSAYGVQEPVPEGLPIAFDESSSIDFSAEPDFLTTLARRWELATRPASDAGVRVVILRIAVVLGQGGALKKMKLPFQLGLGGPIGSGNQPFMWVALTDLVRATDFLIQHPDISGPVNIVSPNTVQQHEFAQCLGSTLGRPAILPMPSFIVRLLFGQMGEETLLRGNHAKPNLLLNKGFEFKLADLRSALQAALN